MACSPLIGLEPHRERKIKIYIKITLVFKYNNIQIVQLIFSENCTLHNYFSENLQSSNSWKCFSMDSTHGKRADQYVMKERPTSYDLMKKFYVPSSSES
jgi:hypothetical protein